MRASGDALFYLGTDGFVTRTSAFIQAIRSERANRSIADRARRSVLPSRARR